MANSAWQFAWITMNTRLVIMWLRQGLEQGYSAVWSERRLGGGRGGGSHCSCMNPPTY